MSKLTEAQEEWDKQKMAAIPIWCIRSKLRKMVVEKLTDFNQFKSKLEMFFKFGDILVYCNYGLQPDRLHGLVDVDNMC